MCNCGYNLTAVTEAVVQQELRRTDLGYFQAGQIFPQRR